MKEHPVGEKHGCGVTLLVWLAIGIFAHTIADSIASSNSDYIECNVSVLGWRICVTDSVMHIRYVNSLCSFECVVGWSDQSLVYIEYSKSIYMTYRKAWYDGVL